MTLIQSILEGVFNMLPFSLTVVLVIAGLWLVDRWLRKYYANKPGHQFGHQLGMLSLSVVGVVIIISALPVSETLRGQLLSLLGLLLSAAIALSSTSFIGNMLAGISLRMVRGFGIGDFLSANDFFGRVTDMGLLHTEIQTEERDLVTLHNIYLATHPFRVIRSSGAIVSATVSLGYDVPRQKIEAALRDAATAANLRDPFVLVRELGDFSVSYQVSGLLDEVKTLVTARSSLRAKVLDILHENDIEIVSPNFMNTRTISVKDRFIPPLSEAPAAEATVATVAEQIVFDKADQAESIEGLREIHK
ncbi:MAG: mechanosensitive ion channel family protein, partial [Gammaproteobacteria bacterium]|nr:mechanosensitive ion channel family protein [Gammaproteobacteria bacterium]